MFFTLVPRWRLRPAALGANNKAVAVVREEPMKLRIAPILAGVAALALTACTSTPMAEVTRFHLGQPIPSDTIRIVAAAAPTAPGPEAPAAGGMSPVAGTTAVPLEFRTYATVVGAELAKRGFRPAESGPTAYLATLGIEQTTRAGIQQRSPVSIGIGGGSGGFGGGFGGGVGGGVSFPLGGSRNGDVRVTVLSLSIRRESDNSAVWEGRAIQELAASAPASSLSAAVPALARALLQEFPGVSGQTVTVKLR